MQPLLQAPKPCMNFTFFNPLQTSCLFLFMREKKLNLQKHCSAKCGHFTDKFYRVLVFVHLQRC